MAALTWRNVDAPDYRASMQGFNNSAEALNNAVSAADRAITRFDTSADDRVNKAFAAQLASFSDSEALKQAMANDPTLGLGSRVSVSSLRSGTSQINELLSRAVSEENFGMTKDQNVRTRDKWGRTDAARGDLAAAYTAGFRGDDKEVQKILGGSAAVANLNPEDMFDAFRNAGGLTSSHQGLLNSRQSYDQSGTRFGWDVTDRDRNQRLEGELGKLSQYASKSDQVSAVLASSLSDRDKGYLIDKLGGIDAGIEQDIGSSAFGGTPGGVGGGGASRISSTGNPYDTLFGDTTKGNAYGFAPAKPVTSMTIGEAVRYGKEVMIPQTKGKINKGGLGTSALGAYQFVSSTLEGNRSSPGLAQQVFGKDWQNVPMTAENQDKMAEHLFNQSKGGNLKAIWEGLPNSASGAYKNVPWEQMRGIIFQHEIAVNSRDAALSRMQGTANTVSGQVGRAGATTAITNAYPAATAFAQNVNDGSTPNQVARETVKADSRFDPTWFEKHTRTILADAQTKIRAAGGDPDIINAAMVGALIRNSAHDQASTEFFGRAIPDAWRKNSVGSDLYISPDEIVSQLMTIGNGEVNDALQSQALVQEAGQLEGGAKAAVAAAQQALARKTAVIARGGRGDTSREEIALRRAQQDLITITGLQQEGGIQRGGIRPADPTPPELARAAPARKVSQGNVASWGAPSGQSSMMVRPQTTPLNPNWYRNISQFQR